MSLLTWMTSCFKKVKESTINVRPDKPVAFGYKCIWITVNADDPKSVADFLKLKEQSTTNWTLGIEQAYADRIFISPKVDSLIFIVGVNLPSADTGESIESAKALVNKLSSRFGKADYFVTHRIVELQGWMKSVKGEIKRAYCYIGERGETLIMEGEPTDFEKQFDLVNTLSKEAEADDYFDKDGLITPDEELVMKVAGDWGVNPTTLELRTDLNEGLGITGRLQ